MSDGTATSNISSTAFADALARARQLAAKLSSGSSAAAAASSPPHVSASQGVKRSADDWKSSSPDSEPEPKRLAAVSDPFGAQLAAMRTGGGGSSVGGSSGSVGGGSTSTFTFPMMGISGSGKACTEEVHIPDGLVGLIIGRGGEQVSRIQAETGCKVQVAPDNGTGKDRSCYLQGSKDSIERAKELIMEIVSSKSHELGRPGGPTAAGGPKVASGSTSIEMTIPGAKVGLIIGKGGETIRSLQDKSGTKMYILQENMFEECDKPLRIVGEPDLVEHARQLVMDLITETPPKPEFFKNKGGGEYGGPGGPGLGGGSGGGSGGGGGGGSGGSSFGGGGPSSSGGAGLETMRFPVPKISVGLIIGKGGEMIKRIQVETGAKVQFDPINSNLGDMDEQLAIITGKPDQIRQAQLRIEDLVETALHGGKPDGAGGGPGGAPGGGGGGGGMGRGRDSHRPHNNWNDGPGGPGGGHHGNKPRDWEEERMSVPVGRVGMVIGKGGETIRAINQQCGAHCEIDRNGPSEGPERVFLIRGTRQQIEYAKELILEKVNTLPPKQNQRDNRGGPGGHHHHGGDHYNQGQSHGWGGGGGYGGQQWGQGDPSKMADTSAQWAAYYAQYYGGHGQPAAQQTQGGAGGQPDYTQQWIEYLRAQGQHAQADTLEQQMKATKSDGSNPPPPGASSQGPAPPGTTPAPPGVSSNGQPGSQPTGAGAAAQNGQTADYSQQWADHYRAMGKVAEAEAIENYIKAQKGQQGTGQPPAPGAGGIPQPGQQPMYPGYPGYGNYYGQQQQQPMQGYGNYPGYGSYPGGAGGMQPPGQGQASSNPAPPPGAAPPPGTESGEK